MNVVSSASICDIMLIIWSANWIAILSRGYCNREGAKNSGGKKAGRLPAQVSTGTARRVGS